MCYRQVQMSACSSLASATHQSLSVWTSSTASEILAVVNQIPDCFSAQISTAKSPDAEAVIYSLQLPC